MSEPHIPVVRITTPLARRDGTPNVLTRITIDDQEWAVTGYQIDGSDIHGVQLVSLTFYADLTVGPSERPQVPETAYAPSQGARG